MIPVEVDNDPVETNRKKIGQALLSSDIFVATVREAGWSKVDSWRRDIIDRDSAG